MSGNLVVGDDFEISLNLAAFISALGDLKDRSMPEHELLFLNPVFHPGLNVTVRNRAKWWNTANIGDKLLIKKTGEDNVVYTGRVVGKAFKPFKELPKNWLAYEHDPDCRTLEGLLEQGMKPAYPDFTEDTYVTVLLFWI